MSFKDWAIQQHRDTNHKYDGILPYEFHLEMVKAIGVKFLEIWEVVMPHRPFYTSMVIPLYGHDLIEDARCTYNDIYNYLYAVLRFDASTSTQLTDIIYAVTNEKGKNRKERANDNYYEGIRNTPGAVFVKLCDRIANVKYGLLTGGSMLNKYKEENEDFLKKLEVNTSGSVYWPMVEYLEQLFLLKGKI